VPGLDLFGDYPGIGEQEGAGEIVPVGVAEEVPKV
jgi:hypothetical protein